MSTKVKGLTVVIVALLSGTFKCGHCHCLCLQETHRDSVQSVAKGSWDDTTRPHKKHGNAIFVSEDLKVKPYP